MTDKNQEITRQLVSCVYGIKYADLSSDTIETAKKCIEDFIGVAIAGSQKKEAVIWKRYYSTFNFTSCSSLLQPDFSMHTAEHAAAMNAVFGHVMDMDDVHNTSITHLGVVTIPTALALCQQYHLSGSMLIEAIVAGYEAGARIGEAINPSSYRFWHTTAVIGAFASSITASKLLGLSEEETLNAFGSAGTQAAGLWEFLESGSMSKVLHVANANLCGIRSAKLARLGFTGSPTILEGERGFLKAFAPSFQTECITKSLCGGYSINEISLKAYACCHHTHSALYCAQLIRGKYHIDPDQIVSITDETYHAAVETADNPDPENPYAAKFSLQFCIAAMLVYGEVSDHIFCDASLKDCRIRSLMNKINVKESQDINDAFKIFPDRWAHRLSITLKDGSSITEQVDYPIGDPKNPFDLSMTDHKFSELCHELLDEIAIGSLLSKIHRLEELNDTGLLFQQHCI